MNAGRTINDLAAEITRQQSTKRDFRVPVNAIEARPITGGVVLAPRGLDETFAMTRNAETQLAEYMHIPATYFDRLKTESPEILASHLTARLALVENDARLLRTLDGKARAFLSNRYRTIDNYDVMQAALPTLAQQQGLQIMSSQVTENRLYIKAVTPRLSYEVKKGDIVQGGVVLSNSEVGAGTVKIEPFFYRLVCLNGMISTEAALRKYHIGRAGADVIDATEIFRDDTLEADDKAFFLKMRDSVIAAFAEARFEKLLQPMLAATERRIEKPLTQVMEIVTKKYTLTEGDCNSILENLAKGGDLSQWGLANAITAMANTETDYEKATSLERLGGEIVALAQPQWAELAAA
jgi:hypothetical protein